MKTATAYQSAASRYHLPHNRYTPPSFLQGMGSVLDLFGVLDDNVQWDAVEGTGEEADVQALCDDFKAVASDLSKSVSQYESAKKTHPAEAPPTV